MHRLLWPPAERVQSIGRSKVLDMGRRRDLFPLPLPFPASGNLNPDQSLHTNIRRTYGSRGLERWANEGVLSLNSLYGCSPARGAPSFLQQGILSELSEFFTTLGSPPANITAATAFKDLAASAVPYSSGGGSPRPLPTGAH